MVRLACRPRDRASRDRRHAGGCAMTAGFEIEMPSPGALRRVIEGQGGNPQQHAVLSRRDQARRASLISSTWTWAEQTAALRRRKAYEANAERGGPGK